jgi:hypothetical protein
MSGRPDLFVTRLSFPTDPGSLTTYAQQKETYLAFHNRSASMLRQTCEMPTQPENFPEYTEIGV